MAEERRLEKLVNFEKRLEQANGRSEMLAVRVFLETDEPPVPD
jgi:hypothetical protein